MSGSLLAPALIASEAELRALESEWWDLWARCPAATPFQSPAWVLPWWGVFRPGRLATVAVRHGGRLAALAPLYVEAGAMGRRLLPIGIGITDYLDVLLDPADVETAGPALMVAAGELVPDWERLDLEELYPGAASIGLPAPPGSQEESLEQAACPVLDLARPDPVPSRKRRKLRMAEHRVARRGGRILTVAPDGVPGFLDELVRLHGARWTARGEDGVLANDPVQRFHSQALALLAEAGLARLWLLKIDERTAGAYYGLQHGPRAYAYLGGFDPAFSFESPGTALVGHAIAQAQAEGAGEFHFLRGQETYKYEWGAVDRPNRRRTFRRHA